MTALERLKKVQTVDGPGKTPDKTTAQPAATAPVGGSALERLERVQTVDGKASAPKSSGKAETRKVSQPSGTSMGQGLALGVGGPSRQQVAQSVDRAEELRKAGYSTGTMLRGMAEQGGDQFVGGVLHTVKDYVEKPLFAAAGAVLGNPELGENAPVKQFSEWFDRRAEERREKYAENAAKGGTAYEKVNEYGSATVAAIPQALVALGTAGGSTAAQGLNAVAAASTRAPGILTTLKNVGEGLARNPNFWTSFLQVAGDGYEEAKADGASDAKAGLFGMVNGLANAAVEVGGGIQTLPAELQQGGKNAIRLWVESMVDEGKEEVVQGILERGLQKLVYDRKNPLFSTEDESAVVNPRTALKEFSGGAVVGGILGGGQMIAQGMASGAGRYAPNGTPLLTDEQGRTYEERMAAEQKNAAPRTEAAEVSLDEARQIARNFGAELRVGTLEHGASGTYENGVITIDGNAKNPVRQVLVHELTHHMESSGLYGEFSDRVLSFAAEDMGVDAEAMARSITEEYRAAGVELSEDAARRELVAKFAEDKLFRDEQSIQRLLRTDRNLFQKIYDWIRDTIVKVKGSSEEKFLADAQKLYEKALRNNQGGDALKTGQNLFAGERSKTADFAALSEARERLAQGADAETVRRETGWFRGMDGKWRFEIDDSGMAYRRDGDAQLSKEPGYQRLQELERRWDSLTEQERAEYDSLANEYQGTVWEEKYLLRDFLRHDDLFRAYPYLNRVSLAFEDLDSGQSGYFDGSSNTIVLSNRLRNQPESTLTHEIQHVIQKVEGFSRGSSPEYWARRDYETGDVTQGLQREYQAILQGLDKDSRNQFTRYQEVNRELDRLQDAEEGTAEAEKYVRLDAESDRLYLALWDKPWFRRLLDLDRQIKEPGEVYNRYYRNTAGEIEARDAAARRGLTAEQRAEKAPDLGNENTVFAEGGGSTLYASMEIESEEQPHSRPYYAESAGDVMLRDADGKWVPRKRFIQAEAERSVRELKDKSPFSEGFDRRILEDRTLLTATEVRKADAELALSNKRRNASATDAARRAVSGAGFETGNVRNDWTGLNITVGNNFYSETATNAASQRNESSVQALRAARELMKSAYLVGTAETQIDAKSSLKRKNNPHRLFQYIFAAPYSMDGPKIAVLRVDVMENQGDVLHRAYNLRSVEYKNAPLGWASEENLRAGFQDRATASGGYTISVADLVKNIKQDYVGNHVIFAAKEGTDITPRLTDEKGRTYEERQNSMGRSFTELVEEQRRAVKAERKTADAKDASSAMKALGLDNITGDLGEYRNTDFLRGADAARKQTVRERRKAEARLHPTNAEKKFARGIANGDFSVEDIPASMSRAVVEEMADRYYAEASYGKRSGLQDRGAEIRRRTEEMARELFEDEESYHPISMLKMNERTPERVMRSIYGEEQGEKINEAYIYPIQRNEANKTRWMREMLDKVRTFQDSNGGQSELTRQERALVQQLMEDRFVGEQLAAMETQGAIRNAAENIRNGADAKDAAREFSLSADELALARQLVRWTENQELLQSGQVDSAKINAAVETFAKQYDLFYDAINDFLTAHGYNTIGFIKGYAPHMQGADTQNKLSNALKALGVLPEAAQLPTSISGLTADYKPGKRWNPFFQSRKGSTTDYDVSKGYESYISYLADIFYHTDDIARLRGVTRYLRRTYGSEQITDAIDHAEGLRTAPLEMQTELLRENGRINGKTVLSEEDTKAAMNEYIDKLYESVEQMTKYGELVKYLDNFANLLAGKQSMADRGMEYMAGRKSLNAANKAVSAFGRAQVAGNVSSVLNQSAQLSQILAEVPTKYVAKAAVDLGKKTGVKFWTIKDTDIFETSDLLSGKKGVDYLTAGDSRMDRFVTALFKPADIMDGAVSALAYQSKYNQLIAEGKPTAAAELGADRWATQIMASRAKGSRPLAFESKNVASQILHMFQVEALNSWEHVSQDLSAQYRKTERTKGKNAAAAQVGAVATKYLLSAFVMNRITEALYGGTPAPFDLLGYVTNAVASGLGMTANEALAQICRKVLGKMGFGDEPDEDDEERDFDWGEAMDALLYDVMNDAPFVRNAAGLLGLGDQTMPLTNIAESVGDVGEAAKNSGVLSAETGEAILGLGANLLPGGRQLQKTYQGAKTMATGGRTYGYGEKARIQYTVDQKNLSKWGQALLFGNSGLSETRDYYAEGKNGLSAKQTQTVQAMAKDGADREEVFQTIKALRDEKTAAEKMEAIDLAELSDSEKLRLYREVVASKDSKRPEQFKGLMEKGLNWGQITDAYGMYAELNDDEELSASQKATQFAAWLDGEDFSAEQRAAVKECFAFWQQMRAEAKRYEALTAEGMNSGTAERLTNALAALEPEDGKEQVSARQRYAAIMDAGLSESDQLRALRSVMDEDAWEKFETANRAGVTPEVYVEFLEETADLQADRAGNGKAIAGSKKQKVLAAIDGLDITKEQKTALYYAAGYAESTLTEAPWMGLQVPRLDGGTSGSRKKSSGKSKSSSSGGGQQKSGLSKYSLDKYRLG